MYRVNPRVDFAFKKLFGVEENKDILQDFINAIVFEEDRIESLELKNPYNAKDFLTDKESILDIRAESAAGKIYNIEMQVLKQDYYSERALYYWGKSYALQLTQGINYDFLKKTICINILNYNCLSEHKYHNIYQVKNLDSGSVLSDRLEIHFIELKKYDERLSSLLDRWTNFLAKAETYATNKIPQQLLEIPTIIKALQAIETMSFNENEREYYEKRLAWLRDESMALLRAKREGVEKGIEEGVEEGIEIGIEKGIEIGVEKGIEIGFEKGSEAGKFKIAGKLIAAGTMSDETIAEMTELTQQEISLIKRKRQTVTTLHIK